MVSDPPSTLIACVRAVSMSLRMSEAGVGSGSGSGSGFSVSAGVQDTAQKVSDDAAAKVSDTASATDRIFLRYLIAIQLQNHLKLGKIHLKCKK